MRKLVGLFLCLSSCFTFAAAPAVHGKERQARPIDNSIKAYVDLLDEDDFEKRKEAYRELQRKGRLVLEPMQQTLLRGGLTLEQSNSLEKLVRELGEPPYPPLAVSTIRKLAEKAARTSPAARRLDGVMAEFEKSLTRSDRDELKKRQKAMAAADVKLEAILQKRQNAEGSEVSDLNKAERILREQKGKNLRAMFDIYLRAAEKSGAEIETFEQEESNLLDNGEPFPLAHSAVFVFGARRYQLQQLLSGPLGLEEMKKENKGHSAFKHEITPAASELPRLQMFVASGEVRSGGLPPFRHELSGFYRPDTLKAEKPVEVSAPWQDYYRATFPRTAAELFLD